MPLRFENLQLNTDYTISADFIETIASSSKVAITAYGYDEEGTLITIKNSGALEIKQNEKGSINVTFNTGNYKRILIRIWSNYTATAITAGTSFIEMTNIQLEKGIKSDYELHQSQTYSISLGSKELNGDDIVRDTIVKKDEKWCYEFNWDKYIFTGEENVIIVDNAIGLYRIGCLNNLKKQKYSKGFSNIAKNVNNWNNLNSEDNSFALTDANNDENYIYFWLHCSTLVNKTTAEIAETLKGNYVYYPVENLICEEITDKVLISQLDVLENMMLYKGTNYINSNANITISLGEEVIPYGNFIIEKPDTEEVQAITRFVGYDYMIKFNKEFVDNNTYPVSLGEYFSNLCTQVGLVAGKTDFINSDYMVLGNPFTNGEKCKEVLSAIAQIAGGIAKIGRDNKPYIISLSNDSELEKIDGHNYDSFSPNKVFGPINKVILKMQDDVEGEESVRSDSESISQNGECAITISNNPILNSSEQRELVIDNIFNALNGITYLPYKTTYYGYPHTDSTDKIKISNVNDAEYDSYIFNHTLKYDGAFSGIIETPALTKSQSAYKDTRNLRDWKRNVEFQVDKINGELRGLVSKTVDLTQKVSANKSVVLANCMNGNIVSLNIKGNNEVFKYLYPSDDLYPADDLYPMGDSRITVTDHDNNTTIYELGVLDVLRKNGDVYDEYILEAEHAKVIRRINKDGTVKETEEIEDLGQISIELKEGTNILTIMNYTGEITVTYVVKNGLTNVFASKVEMNASIIAKTNEIDLRLEEKLDEKKFTGANITLAINNDTSGAEINADKVSLKRQTDRFNGR